MVSLRSHLVKYARSLPRTTRLELERYLASRSVKDPDQRPRKTTYWRELPFWLFNSYRTVFTRRDLPLAFLNEVRWGQQCLFLAIRIQDDLFDGDSSSPALVCIADQFLIEADRTFSQEFDRSSQFWEMYRSCLSKTTGSILEVDGLQRKVTRDLQKLERAYAGVNALFEIGPGAICIRAKRAKDFPSISKFCDEMAIAGQILDDMRDLGEDLTRERFNYVASFFLRRQSTPLPQQAARGGAVKELLLNGSIAELFQILHQHINLAECALAKLDLPGASCFFQHYRENLRHREGHLSRRHVDFVLNSLV